MPCSALRHVSFAEQPHPPTTPAHAHAGTTRLHLNHAHLGSRFPQRAINTTGVCTTPCITRTQHNGLPYHVCTTGAGTPEPAQRAFWKRNSLHPYQKRSADHAPRTPNMALDESDSSIRPHRIVPRIRFAPSCESAAKANRIRLMSDWCVNCESDSPIQRIGGNSASDSPNIRLVAQRRIGEATQPDIVGR